nr:DUF72 domain-containing protein [Treponema sp.]
TQFNALELNNTFYNMPTAEKLLSFYERANGSLNFSIKANRLLTHEITTQWETAAQDFKNAIKPVYEKNKLSALLFQFPQSFHYTNDNRIYLSKLIQYFEGYPVMIEFRHTEWIKASVFEGLEKLNVGLVFCDMPQLKYLPDGKALNSPFIGSNAYIRLHGRNEKAWYAEPQNNTNVQNASARYLYDYSEQELQNFVPVIIQAKASGKTIQLYFNNHPNGNGPKNAVTLKAMLFSALGASES